MSRAGIEPAKRAAVLRLLNEGRSKVDVARITGVGRATIFRMIQREAASDRRN